MINIHRERYHWSFWFYSSIYPPPNFFLGGGVSAFIKFSLPTCTILNHLSIRFYPLFHFKIFIFTKIEPSSSSGQPNQFLKDNDYKLYVVHMLLEYVYTVVSLSFMCINFFLSKIYLNFTTIESLSLSLFLMDIYFMLYLSNDLCSTNMEDASAVFSFQWNMPLLKLTGIC